MKKLLIILSFVLLVMSCNKSGDASQSDSSDSIVANVDDPLFDSLRNSVFQPAEQKLENPEHDADAKFKNYKDTEKCTDSEVIYEGRGGYYLVDAFRGYAIIEVIGGMLYPGQWVRGDFSNSNTNYILNKTTGQEMRVMIEDIELTKDQAIDWLGFHRKLSFDDQEVYDDIND